MSNGLESYSRCLAKYERWLVLNKLDLIPEEEREEHCQQVIDKLNWTGPVYSIAAINKQGTFKLCADIMEHIEARRERALEDPDFAEEIEAERELVDAESRAHIEQLQERRREERELDRKSVV